MHWSFYSIFWPVFWIVFWSVSRLARRRLGNSRIGPAAELTESNRPPREANELTELRERVKVLERITVDERHSTALATEIESLRGK